jgi:hypothetical protein
MRAFPDSVLVKKPLSYIRGSVFLLECSFDVNDADYFFTLFLSVQK